jgi:hypothetical protein
VDSARIVGIIGLVVGGVSPNAAIMALATGRRAGGALAVSGRER